MCFRIRRKKPPPEGLARRWNKQPVNVWIGPAPTGSKAPALTMQALTSLHCDFRMVFVTQRAKADITIEFYTGPWVQKGVSSLPPKAADNLGGRTTFPDDGPIIRGVSIWLNQFILEDHGGYPEVFKATALHETGHAMGFEHRWGVDDLMNPDNVFNGHVNSFSVPELAIINAAY